MLEEQSFFKKYPLFPILFYTGLVSTIAYNIYGLETDKVVSDIWINLNAIVFIISILYGMFVIYKELRYKKNYFIKIGIIFALVFAVATIFNIGQFLIERIFNLAL